VRLMSHIEARSLAYDPPDGGRGRKREKRSPRTNSGWRSKCSGKSIFAIAKEGLGVWVLITPPLPPARQRTGARMQKG
jgi:hypothetical protein